RGEAATRRRPHRRGCAGRRGAARGRRRGAGGPGPRRAAPERERNPGQRTVPHRYLSPSRSLEERIMKRLLCLAALLAAAPAASAQGSKPLRIVVPYAAGGAVDVVSRAVGQRMSELTGGPVIVDNRPGGNANIGADAVAKSAADGATLLMGANGLATNVSLFKSLPFDARSDFAPVARVGYAPLVLVVAPESPAKSLKELLALAKSQPGKLNYGSAGNGSSQHLATELLRLQTGVDVVHVPYKGGAPAVTDLMGGRPSFFITHPLEGVAPIKSGRLRAIALGSPQPPSPLPPGPNVAPGRPPGSHP